MTKCWGNPCEGDSFCFTEFGSYVKSLKVSSEDYLNYLEPIYGNAMFMGALNWKYGNGEYTEMIGPQGKGQIDFNDFEFIDGKFNFKVTKVNLWHDGKELTGIQFFYAMSGTTKTPGQKLATMNQYTKQETLVLEEGEYINTAFVKVSNCINYLTIITNTGKSISAGNPGTGTAYLAKAKEGFQFGAVGGGYCNSIQQIQFYGIDIDS